MSIRARGFIYAVTKGCLSPLKSMTDLGNLVAAAWVFERFVTGQRLSMVTFGIGLIVTAALNFRG
jgi:hypothetical protein